MYSFGVIYGKSNSSSSKYLRRCHGRAINQPGKYDAVLGGQSPPPITGAVLGGIEGIKRRLSNPVVDVKLAALTDALNYQDAGLELVIQALRWEPKKLQRHAYKLLRRREEARVKQALREYQPWDLFERLQGYRGYKGLARRAVCQSFGC